MALTIVTPATVLPVTLAEAKAQCRIADADNSRDALLTQAIWDATASIETLTGGKMSATTLQLSLDEFPANGGAIDLGVYPVRSVTLLEYDDPDGVEIALNSGVTVDYWSALGGIYPRVIPSTYWPATQAGKPDSVRILMAAGYVGSPPRDLCRAILMRVAEYFENTSESIVGTIVSQTETTVQVLTEAWQRRFL